MKKIFRGLLERKTLDKNYLKNICKKYKLSKSKIFGFLSFSEELFNKTDFKKYKK